MAIAREEPRPVVFTNHARRRMLDRGAQEEDVLEAICAGQKEPAQRGLFIHRLNLEYQREWDGKYYAVQQVVPVVAEERDRIVVVRVYTFYF